MKKKIYTSLAYGFLAMAGCIGLASLLWAAVPSGSPVIYSASDTVTLPSGTTFNAQILNSLGAFSAASTVAYSGIISPTQITANQNNYSPTGLSTATILRLFTDASRNITGLQGGASGRWLILINVGSFNLVLVNESASSDAANRFGVGADLTLGPGAMVVLLYDPSPSSRWRTVSPTLTGGIVQSTILKFAQQSSDPSVDASAWQLYAKSTGISVRDPAGNITGPLGTGGGGSATFATVRVATTANITLSGTQTIDGVSNIGANNELVLVKNQTTGTQNGPYVSSSGAWTRSTSFDTSGEFTAGFPVFVQSGTVNGGTVWNFANTGSFTLGSDAPSFTRTGAGAFGELLANKDQASGYAGLTSGSKLKATQLGDYAAHAALSNATTINPTISGIVRTIVGVECTSGTCDLTSDPQITAGTSDGQLLMLVSTDPTKPVKLDHGTGIALCGGAGSIIVGSQAAPIFRWKTSTSVWEQIGCQREFYGASDAASAFKAGTDPNTHLRFYGTTIEAIINGVLATGTTINNLIFGTNGSKPTCASGERFKVWPTAGGAGVADAVEVCDKDAGDSYAWRSLGGGATAQQVLMGSWINTGLPCSSGGEQSYLNVVGRGLDTTDPSNEAKVQQPLSRAATATRISVLLAAAVPSGETMAFTLRESGSNTSLTCSVTAGNTTCTGTATEAIAQDAPLTMGVVCSGGTTTVDWGSWGVTIE